MVFVCVVVGWSVADSVRHPAVGEMLCIEEWVVGSLCEVRWGDDG